MSANRRWLIVLGAWTLSAASVAAAPPAKASTPPIEKETPPTPVPRKSDVPAARSVQRVLQMKTPEIVNRQLVSLFSDFPVDIKIHADTGSVALSGSAEAVASVEDVLRRLDSVTRKNIEITAQVVLAQVEGPTATIPRDLESVVQQLKSTMMYRVYRVIETMSLRVREGETHRHPAASISGKLSPAADQNWPYDLYIDAVKMSTDDRGNMVRLSGVTFSVAVTDGKTRFMTDVDMAEGQKAVVGKSSANGNDAIVLVLTAKVME